MRDVLRLPLYRRLLTAYTVNEIGDSIALVALALLVYDETRSPVATTALLLATRVVPAALAPLLIARVDQGAPNRILSRLYLAEGAVFAVLAVLSEHFWLPAVLVLGLVDGTLALSGRALIRSAIAFELVPRDLLRKGNGVFNVAFAAAAAVGSGLGGLLAAEFGVAAALLADALSFVVIAGLLIATVGLQRAVADHAREPFRERLRGGLRFVAGDRRIRLLLGVQALALVLLTLITPIEVVYARETLEVAAWGFGALLGAWGLGLLLGSWVFLKATRTSSRVLVTLSTAAVGVAYVGMANTEDIYVACGLSVVGGAGNGVQWVAVVTALQRATPPDYQARIVGLLESLGAAAPGVGYLLGGALTSASSPATAYAVAGWGLIVLVVAGTLAALAFPKLLGAEPTPPARPRVSSG